MLFPPSSPTGEKRERSVPAPAGDVRFAPSAALGVAVLALLLAFGPVSGVAGGTAAGTAFLAGLIGAALVFTGLTAAERLLARRMRRLGLGEPTVLVNGWGPTLQNAPAPRSWQQARVLATTRPAALAAAAAALALLAAVAGAASLPPLAAALGAAGVVTLAMLVLDLLPGPARSGGLLVLARAWRRRDRLSAEVAVARSGMRSGWVLIAAGLAAVFAVGPIGLWLGLLGWLLLVTSRVAASRATFRQAAAAVPGAAAMSTGVPEVPGWRSVAAVLDEVVLPARRQVFPVRTFDGRADSVVLLADLAAVPADDRDLRRAQDVARPAASLR